MARKERSPKITHLSWGRIEVEGRRTPFKDAKLFPGGAREWDWGETGTEHIPGIQPADVEELLARGAEEVILTKGVYEQLNVCPETLEMLRERSIPAHVLQTEEAARLYNELREKKLLGALFHTTC